MRGKVKLKLNEEGYIRALRIYLKIEGEWFYWHSAVVVSYYEYNDDGRCIHSKTDEEFYDDVIEYISDINNIKRDGELLMRKVIEGRLQDAKDNNKEETVRRMLKELKKPIEIEVKM